MALFSMSGSSAVDGVKVEDPLLSDGLSLAFSGNCILFLSFNKQRLDFR